MATVGGIDPNFTGQATGEPPYARLPPVETLFARRADRFEVLAEGHAIGDYLRFLATLSRAQQTVALAMEAPALPDASVALAHGMPPLDRALADAPGALSTLAALLAALGAAPLAEGPAQALERLRAADEAERSRLLTSVADGYYELERLAECALVAAALQVWFSAHAARFAVEDLRNIGETLCPCCGGAPVSSMIRELPQAATGLRYLTCATCLTEWNHVRVKCTACGDTRRVSYRRIEDGDESVGAEVCEACRGYAKHLSAVQAPDMDAVADDVASYGLDMKLREEDWRRTGLNPFLILP